MGAAKQESMREEFMYPEFGVVLLFWRLEMSIGVNFKQGFNNKHSPLSFFSLLVFFTNYLKIR